MSVPTPDMIERGVKAMQRSKAWPAVFDAGSARVLLEAALNALLGDTHVIVPKEPTVAMYDAAIHAAIRLRKEQIKAGRPYKYVPEILPADGARTIVEYRAMLQAAAPPADVEG